MALGCVIATGSQQFIISHWFKAYIKPNNHLGAKISYVGMALLPYQVLPLEG
jgi:hypothetical protein